MSELILVRHGESYHNKKGLVCGDYDSPLTALGRKQATALAQALPITALDNAFASSLNRARDTLDCIVKCLPSTPHCEITAALKERRLGTIVGQPESSFSPEQWALWMQWDGAPPQGESYADVHRRVIPWFESRITQLLAVNKNVLVVSHQAVIKVLRQHLEHYPLDATGTLGVPNCGILHYQYTNEVIQLISSNAVTVPAPAEPTL
jgi:broad specificity phosphatase PhoE